ncbi:MAG TPA: hypothetical protein VNK51_22390 [Bradyrhizobium sp.]|nr:hypothetical protein [Bradyrhizobium sp.]
MNAGNPMRLIKFVSALLVASSGQLHAQMTVLPEVTVEPPGARSGTKGGGPRDGSGSAKGNGTDGPTFDRLNKQLKRKVDETHPLENVAPLDARSPDTKTGVVNIPGVQQQYGKNFGHSAFPYRPPAPVYGAPLGPHR